MITALFVVKNHINYFNCKFYNFQFLMLLSLILDLFLSFWMQYGSFSHNLWASFHILLVILPHVIIFLLERLLETEPCSVLI